MELQIQLYGRPAARLTLEPDPLSWLKMWPVEVHELWERLSVATWELPQQSPAIGPWFEGLLPEGLSREPFARVAEQRIGGGPDHSYSKLLASQIWANAAWDYPGAVEFSGAERSQVQTGFDPVSEHDIGRLLHDARIEREMRGRAVNCSHEEDVHLSCTGVSGQTEATPLTATLENLPTNHYGSIAFTFRIAFSADVDITPEDMRDRALTVIGATVTNAVRVDGRSDLWELRLEPAGTGEVSILVQQDRACTETGALCTAEGVTLSTGLGHSVPGPAPQGQQALAPLAASFVSVPAEHDGETEFWLELTFDAAVEQGSKERIQALLGANGGSMTRLRPQGRAARPLADQGRTLLARGRNGVSVAFTGLRRDGRSLHGRRAHVHERHRRTGPRPTRPRGRGCSGGGSGKRGIGLRGDTQPTTFGHGNGRVRNRGRNGNRRV